MRARHFLNRPTHRSRESGQIIVLFALALLGLLAMIGVVVDGGTLYVQRRTAQNAADAAALAGTRVLQQATLQSTGTIGDAICTYVLANSFGVTPTATANFVDTTGRVNLGSINLSTGCGASPPSWIPNGASGIHVAVAIGPYNTYLAGIVGVRQLEADASATAQVGVLSIPRPDLTPLAGCGPDMLVDGTSPTPFRNILTPSKTINSARYGDDLVLEGSQMAQNEVPPQGSNCPAWNGSSSAWKGQVVIDGVTGALTPPFQLPVDTGNSSIDGWVSDTCIGLYGLAGDPSGETAASSTCYLSRRSPLRPTRPTKRILSRWPASGCTTAALVPRSGAVCWCPSRRTPVTTALIRPRGPMGTTSTRRR
jgi:Flp pilus assembly protein TadG